MQPLTSPTLFIREYRKDNEDFPLTFGNKNPQVYFNYVENGYTLNALPYFLFYIVPMVDHTAICSIDMRYKVSRENNTKFLQMIRRKILKTSVTKTTLL